MVFLLFQSLAIVDNTSQSLYRSDELTDRAARQGDNIAARMALNSSNAQTPVNLKAAFKHQIYNAAAQPLQFGSLFTLPVDAKDERAPTPTTKTAHDRLLVVFIRHFFCGFCQEYLRQLIKEPLLSPTNLALHKLRVVVIGCGAPSLINSYHAVTGMPTVWQIYTDPSTELYRLFDMHRTLSMGSRSPRYVQRSMTIAMLRSIVQGVKRIPEGDVGGAGGLNINGGEFLFTFQDTQPLGRPNFDDWRLSWCHRMRNSRDHTEVEDLLRVLDLTFGIHTITAPSAQPTKSLVHIRTQSTPLATFEEKLIINEKLKVVTTVRRNSSFRRSLSVRRQSWMNKAGQLARSGSMKRPTSVVQSTHLTAVAA
ncbi:hypothetical protein H2198_002836 [Neophaeococcomyces mojaviensis]|uniref:Uncharacterized protein n=1 Tax=Neophaeococcomyces mojaviensis TaxID=3383035 RepID=A0ACC3ACZ7_9EURO|nr:hypothetical protein H2198_002836 [Knufia sp. JES_112]